MLDLEAIKKRCEAATPGPWGTYPCPSGGLLLLRHPDAPLVTRPLQSMIQIVPAEDANFIAHARDDIPALVALVEAQETRIAQLEAEAVQRQQAWEADAERWKGIFR